MAEDRALQGSPAADFFGIHVPFLSHIGVEGIRAEDGEAEIALTLHKHLTNSLDAGHGGVIATLLDVAMAGAARSLEPGLRVVTVNMAIQYLRPATGARLKAVGHVLHRTASLVFCEAKVYSADGQIASTSTGCFKSFKPK